MGSAMSRSTLCSPGGWRWSVGMTVIERQYAKAYRAGQTLREIADAAGVSFVHVQRVLRGAGVELRPPGPRTAWHAQVPRLLAQGLDYDEIAERLGRHRSTVERVARGL
jgi:uncharacterized protein YerC